MMNERLRALRKGALTKEATMMESEITVADTGGGGGGGGGGS